MFQGKKQIYFKAQLTIICSFVIVAVFPKTTILRAEYEVFVNFLWILAPSNTFLRTFAGFVLVQVCLIVWIEHSCFIISEELLFGEVGHDMETHGSVRANLFCSVNYCLHLWSLQRQLGNARCSVIQFQNATKSGNYFLFCIGNGYPALRSFYYVSLQSVH